MVAAVGAAAGAGAYAYYQGNSLGAYAADFGETYHATKLALADLAMPIRHEQHDGLTGEIESSIEDGTHVSIKLEEKPRILATDGHQTEVTIRVGYLGDSKVSARLQQQINQHVTQRTQQQGSATRLPAITQTQGVQSAPPPAAATGSSAPPPMTSNPGWKPATQPEAKGTQPPP